MPTFVILDAPSIPGLHPSGVEYLPRALRAAGLLEPHRQVDALEALTSALGYPHG
jgi:hypothetical protein